LVSTSRLVIATTRSVLSAASAEAAGGRNVITSPTWSAATGTRRSSSTEPREMAGSMVGVSRT
jgi:hypothetical protein